MKKYQLELNEKEMDSVASMYYWAVHCGSKGQKGERVETDKKLLKRIGKMYPMKEIKKRFKKR